MSIYKAFSPNVEVNGETVLSVVDGMGTFKTKALAILKDNGIDNPVPGKWYSQQSWLNSFKKIAESIGQATLNQIGKKIPENAKFPPQIDSIEKALAAIDMAYHMNHRGGEIGHYKFEQTGPRSAIIVCNNPYPCNFDKGIIEAMAWRFKSPGAIIKVTHSSSDPCRDKGNTTCTYSVSW